jgi:hypothetical protein
MRMRNIGASRSTQMFLGPGFRRDDGRFYSPHQGRVPQ